MSPMDKSNSLNASILKETREHKGLTLEIVHEATKIPMDALKAIEEGYSVRILSPFYYRGFIKIYAEFLGVDVEEAWKQYGIESKQKGLDLIKAAPVKAAPRRNVAVENTQEAFSNVFKPANIALVGRIAAVLIALFCVVKIGGCIASHMKSAPKKKVVVEKQSKKNTVKEEAAPKVVEEPKVAPVQNKVEAETAIGRKVELAVRATRDSYVQVKADDRVVFQMTMKKGTMESWSADDHIELSGKNINELDLEVNGKHIGPLGSSERRAKRVMITKEGLTVKK